MKINEDNKIDILRDLLKERYEASHKMRDRSLKFAIWVLGFGIALIWILLSGLSLGLVQKIILTIFVVIVGFLTGIFLKSIDKGFVNNRKVMIRIEEVWVVTRMVYTLKMARYSRTNTRTYQKRIRHTLLLFITGL